MLMAKFCTRCTHHMENEEKYMLFEAYYCRACVNTIEIDPDFAFIFKRHQILAMKEALWKLRNIEN